MKRIIAIGGGEISKQETLEIDREIIRLSGVKCPKILFIPTASNDARGYIESFNDLYGNQLGCETDVLLLHNVSIELDVIRRKILNSDIIYVGGGNTDIMLKLWKKNSIDVLLKEAYENEIILCGLSAGAICWFANGIGLVKGLFGPHYQVKEVEEEFNQWIHSHKSKGLALEDGCAIEFSENEFRIIKANKNAKAFRIHYSEAALVKSEIKNSDYLNRDTLL